MLDTDYHNPMQHNDVIAFSEKIKKINNFKIVFSWFLKILEHYIDERLSGDIFAYCKQKVIVLKEISFSTRGNILCSIEDIFYESNIIFLQRGEYPEPEIFIILISHLYGFLASHYQQSEEHDEDMWLTFQRYFSWIYEDIDKNVLNISLRILDHINK